MDLRNVVDISTPSGNVDTIKIGNTTVWQALRSEPGYIVFRFHLYNWKTGAVLPGVKMRVNVVKNHVQYQVGTGTSDSNGVCEIRVTHGSDGKKIGTQTVTPSSVQMDCDPTTSGYSWDISKSGHVRNWLRGYYSAALPQGTHDDITFTSNWYTHSPTVELECFLKKA